MQHAKRNTGPNALRRGRWSASHATYFTTVCVHPRQPILLSPIGDTLMAEQHRMTADGSWQMRCSTVMPDHLHLLFTLGERLSLSQAIARMKRTVASSLRSADCDWQDNFYDHRLRAEDSIEATIRYIWLNPYRAGLIAAEQCWPYFYCCDADWQWFQGTTRDDRPFPEWLL